jgi:four helix bundle protein
MQQHLYSTGFRALIVWQEAKALTLLIYELTKSFPKFEQYGISSQLQRAASSIMANIAEGSAMRTKDHRNSYYVRARGSTAEVDTFAELSYCVKYITETQGVDIIDRCARISYLLTRLMDAS